MSGLVISTRRAADSSSADGSGDGGGNVEDILRRLGNLEASVSELKSQVSAILAIIPHLATKADLMASVADLRASVAAVETSIIKWIIATTLATGGLAFTIAKFVH
jgi:hypothetical protein